MTSIANKKSETKIKSFSQFKSHVEILTSDSNMYIAHTKQYYGTSQVMIPYNRLLLQSFLQSLQIHSRIEIQSVSSGMEVSCLILTDLCLWA